MKVWITKYALTGGIQEMEGGLSGERQYFFSNDNSYCIAPNHWHKTRAEAVTCAEQMRQKKIASLEKQIDRLKKLKFE